MSKFSFFQIGFLSLLVASSSVAQPHQGQVGISASLQSLQLDFTVPIWVAEPLAVAPSVGFLSSSDQATDLGIALALRYYVSKQKLAPYVGLRGGALVLIPKNGSTVTDKLFGLFFGGEYFLDSQFSVGGELQLNFTFSDKSSNRFGNPNGTNINNATALHATFYF
jgi:hypothetical protein